MAKITTNNANILKLINILAIFIKKKQTKIENLKNACNNPAKNNHSN